MAAPIRNADLHSSTVALVATGEAPTYRPPRARPTPAFPVDVERRFGKVILMTALAAAGGDPSRLEFHEDGILIRNRPRPAYRERSVRSVGR